MKVIYMKHFPLKTKQITMALEMKPHPLYRYSDLYVFKTITPAAILNYLRN